MVAVLLLVIVLGVIQAALLVHARNVAAAVAADAARYAANADRDAGDGSAYAATAMRDALSASYAQHLSCRTRDDSGAGALTEVRVECAGRLPLRIFGVGSIGVDVVGHAVKEGG
jgi:Flp pilus assembly protein TadG